jgi:hypothetical protein
MMKEYSMSTPETIDRWVTYLSSVDCGQLGLREWAEITGIGARPKYGQYEVRLSGVYPRGYTDAEIEGANTEQQIFMLQINSHHPLAFPFTLQRLLEFVDGPDGNVGGLHFALPEGFREAATILLSKPQPINELCDISPPTSIVNSDISLLADSNQVGDCEAQINDVGKTGPVWWSVARTEGERWYAEMLKNDPENGPPIEQKHIADYLDQWLYDKGYRGRSRQRISKSSILEQISGIANRQKDGMGWK